MPFGDVLMSMLPERESPHHEWVQQNPPIYFSLGFAAVQELDSLILTPASFGSAGRQSTKPMRAKPGCLTQPMVEIGFGDKLKCHLVLQEMGCQPQKKGERSYCPLVRSQGPQEGKQQPNWGPLTSLLSLKLVGFQCQFRIPGQP